MSRALSRQMFARSSWLSALTLTRGVGAYPGATRGVRF
jgi:hypothetical protein